MGRNVAFGRAPKKGEEEKKYTQSIDEAFQYLGVQNPSLILHGPSFPADLNGYDAGVGSPQIWGIAVLDPNKLFNKDGSLGPAGRFLKAKLANGMAGAQNVRIDHAIGLVDPYIYKESSVHKIWVNGVQMADRSKLEAARMSESGIDKYGNYKRILPEIVIPTMREMGIDLKKQFGKIWVGNLNFLLMFLKNNSSYLECMA